MNATPTPDRLYAIGELAELTGVSRRTVHFYVQRRLIDPPLGRGRGRHYDQRHVEQIRRVRALQRRGVPLDDMADGGLARVGSWSGAPGEPPDAQPVVRVRIDQNVTVEVAQTAATPELFLPLAPATSSVVSEHRGRSETGAAAGRRPQGAAAGPAPTPSPGPGAHRSESEEKEEP